jgi:hypothetical protein
VTPLSKKISRRDKGLKRALKAQTFNEQAACKYYFKETIFQG